MVSAGAIVLVVIMVRIESRARARNGEIVAAAAGTPVFAPLAPTPPVAEAPAAAATPIVATPFLATASAADAVASSDAPPAAALFAPRTPGGRLFPARPSVPRRWGRARSPRDRSSMSPSGAMGSP